MSSQANHGVRNSASQRLHDVLRFCKIRSVSIGLTIFICAWSAWITAQQSEEAKKVADACDIEITPIDPQQLATDPEKTKARVIALMLQDMDRCIGVQSTRIASAQQANTPGSASGSAAPSDGSSINSSSQMNPSEQTQSQSSQASAENATTHSNSADAPSANSTETTLADVLRNATNSPSSIQHNTNVFDIGSDDELVLDDYAKTLHEAYLAETDPVLKEALAKELHNYLNNKKR